MRIRSLLSFPHHFIFLITITFLILCCSARIADLSAQSHKLSKKELRIALVDSIYDAAILRGLNPKDPLQYDYYFTDATEKHIENLKEKLEQDSFEIIKLSPGDYVTQEDKIWHLQARKNKVYSRGELQAG